MNNGYLEAAFIKRVANGIFGKITVQFPAGSIDMAQFGMELE